MNCCPAGSHILMSDLSVKQIEDIVVGDKVLGCEKLGDGNPRGNFEYTETNVLKTFQRNSVVYEYRMNDGAKIRCTKDHLWLSGGRYLSHGDERRKTAGGFFEYINPIQGRKIARAYSRLDGRTCVDFSSSQFKLGYIHGALAGEGTFKGRANGISKEKRLRLKSARYRFFVKDFSYYQRFKSFVKDLVGLSHTHETEWVRIDGVIRHLNPGTFERRGYGPKDGLGEGFSITLNVDSYRRIKSTKPFKTASDSYISGWLSGIIDAEGCQQKCDVRIAQCSVSNFVTHRLIKDALERFGFRPTEILGKDHRGKGWRIGKTPDIIRLSQLTDITIKRKIFMSIHGKRLMRCRDSSMVLERTSLGEMKVFSLKTGTGNYISQGLVSSNCSYCPQKIHVEKYAERIDSSSQFAMRYDDFVTCIGKIPKNVEIQFAGMAEPFLNHHCADMILAAHGHGHNVSVFTTLAGAGWDDIESIQCVPFRVFCVHLPDKEKQMTLKIDDEYLATLRYCVEHIPNTTFMIVGTVPDEIRKIVGDVTDFSHGLYSRAGNLKDRAIPRKTGKLKHLPCMHHSVLLPNGDVVLCCQDYGQKHILGSLLNDPYDQLFSGKEFARILNGLEDESIDILCRHCEVAEEVK